MFVYGNEFQHLEIEFKPKLLVIPYLSIKKINTKIESMNHNLKHLKSMISTMGGTQYKIWDLRASNDHF
jgi:hypothetical protein